MARIFTKEEVNELYSYWSNKGCKREEQWTDERVANLVDVLNLASKALDVVADGSKSDVGYSTQFLRSGSVSIYLRWNGYLNRNNEMCYEFDDVLHLNVDDMNDAEKKCKLIGDIEQFKTTWS